MSHDDEAHLAVENARDALRENRRSDARQWAERAARLAPHMEDPWLILAAIADPRTSLQYLQRAQKINPESARARRGVQWAMERLRQEEVVRQPEPSTPEQVLRGLPAVQAAPAFGVPSSPAHAAGPRPRRSMLLLALALAGIGLFVCVVAAVSAIRSPVLASIVQRVEPTHPASFALASIPKPTYTPGAPVDPVAYEPQPTAEQPTEAAPTLEVPTIDFATPTLAGGLPSDQPTSEPPTAEPTWSGGLDLTFVDDTPTVAVPAPSAPGYNGANGERWIDVDLTQQRLYAYEGNTLVNTFLVSTGTWLHPTVTGQYHIYVKLRYTDMSGPDYYLPNVPYTMYFYKGYGLHGTYWHHNFGTPMSHGCVNESIPDSEWLFNFASVGTLVNIHY